MKPPRTCDYAELATVFPLVVRPLLGMIAVSE